MQKVRNAEVKRILESEELKEDEIEEMVKKFLRNVKNGTWKSEGWPSYWTDYAVSKLALNAYSKVLAKRYNNNKDSYKLGSAIKLMSVNCFCPGFTQTSMTKGKGTHTADQAASLAAILTLLPPHHLLPESSSYSKITPPSSMLLILSFDNTSQNRTKMFC
jgi:NAD(P)-dependent dehydrogenase (short-subunit alcohol dehydrogenase family)